nr:MFS transporter [Leucobacter weissii]
MFCAAIATFAQIYSPQGLLPELADEFGVGAGTSSLAVGATTIGLAVGMLPWGRLSDRIGRVAALRWAICAAVAVGLAGPFMPTFEWLIAARLVEGLLLAGLPAIGVVALSETVSPLVLGGAVGSFVAGNTIGGLLGRILATNVGECFGWRWGLFAVALLAAVSAILFLLLMPPTAIAPPPGLPLFRAMLENLRNPGVMVMVAQALLLMGGFVAAYNYLAFRLQAAPFELSLSQASWLFLAYVGGALSSRGVWVCARWLPPVGLLLASVAVMLGGLALTLLHGLPAVVAGLVVFTAGFFGAHSIALALVSRRADGSGRSLAPSLYYLGYYAGSTLLGWAGGYAFLAAGWPGVVAMIVAVSILAASLAWAHAAGRGGLRAVDG